jgi:hypothetical protein
MTTLPAFSKLTVMRRPIIDWICPSPQAGRLGWRTKAPGVSAAFDSILRMDRASSHLMQRGKE